MGRPTLPWFWIGLAALLVLLPGPARSLLLDLLGGLTLTLLLLPLLAGAAALIGWRILRRRLRTCSVCGVTSLGAVACPACGAPLPADGGPGSGASPFVVGGMGEHPSPPDRDAGTMTITVEAQEVGADHDCEG